MLEFIAGVVCGAYLGTLYDLQPVVRGLQDALGTALPLPRRPTAEEEKKQD